MIVSFDLLLRFVANPFDMRILLFGATGSAGAAVLEACSLGPSSIPCHLWLKRIKYGDAQRPEIPLVPRCHR